MGTAADLTVVMALARSLMLVAGAGLPLAAHARECLPPIGEPKGIPYEDGKEKANAGWAFYFDNDALTPAQTDEDYTYGAALTLAGRRARSGWINLDRPLGWLDESLGFARCNPFELHSLQVGLVAFTPGVIAVPTVIDGDRPYASIVYLANGRNYIRDRDSPVYHSSVAVGILGLRIAGALQNGLHRAIGSEDAEGWAHQISAGGEPTVRYTLARQDLLASDFQQHRTEFELKSSVAGSVGYLTDVSVALSIRWGLINTPWWSFPPERVEYIAEPAPVIGGTDIRPGSREFYIWSGVKLRARAYNAFLQGQFRGSDLDYDYRDTRPLVGETWLGVTAQLSAEYRLAWIIRYQTSELRDGPGDRDAIWGTMFVSRDL